MALLPRLPKGMAIVDPKTGLPTLEFTIYWQKVLTAQEDLDEAQDQLIEDTGDLLSDIISLNELLVEAEETIEAVNSASELTNSYVSGLTISATDAGANVTITISAHTRHYPQPDGSTRDVSVNGGSVTGQPYSSDRWIYYDQASRTGGAVTYAASATAVAQIGDRHSVGAVTTPAALAAPTGGNGVRPPGFVEP